MGNRIVFDLAASGGAASGDTGYLDGFVHQIRWVPTPADTGQPGTLSLAVVPDKDDTGSGWVFYSQAVANLGVGFTAYPRVADGADTGVEVMGVGDRLRADVVGGDTGVVINGKLYVYVA